MSSYYHRDHDWQEILVKWFVIVSFIVITVLIGLGILKLVEVLKWF